MEQKIRDLIQQYKNELKELQQIKITELKDYYIGMFVADANRLKYVIRDLEKLL